MKKSIIIVAVFLLIALLSACKENAGETSDQIDVKEDNATSVPADEVPGYRAEIAKAQTIDEVNELLRKYYDQKDYPASLAACDRCIEIDPDFEETYYMIVEINLLMLEQQYEKTNEDIANNAENVADKRAYFDWIQEYYNDLGMKIEFPFTSDYADDSEINLYGNTSGRMNSWEMEGDLRLGGMMASQGSWIYFADPNDNNAIYKMNKYNKSLQRLNDGGGNFLNVAGDYIYYSNTLDNGCIYSMRTDGTEMKKLEDGFASFVSVYDGWIYYCNESDEGHLYRMQTDGSENQKLLEKFVISCYMYEGWIYYMDKTGGGALSRISPESGEDMQLNEEGVINYCIADGWIYYMTDHDGLKINKMQLDGNEQQEIFSGEGKVYNFVVFDNRMYVNTRDEENNDVINMYVLDTMEWIKPFWYPAIMFYIADNEWLYFIDSYDWNEWYRINIDTDEIEKLK